MTQLIYGIHAVQAALNNPARDILEIYFSSTRQPKKLINLLDLAKERDIRIKELSREEFDRLLGQANHQGIAAKIGNRETVVGETELLTWIEKSNMPVLLLILDGVQDPHNLGACLRTADAAGVMAVVVPKDKAVSLTPTVRKVASGAAESVPFVQVTNLARFLKQIKQQGIWCYGLAGEAAKTIYDMDFKGHTALVLGGEGNGLRQLTRESCDELLSIPMAGEVSSVNVSVATGISLFEVVRQRTLRHSA